MPTWPFTAFNTEQSRTDKTVLFLKLTSLAGDTREEAGPGSRASGLYMLQYSSRTGH